MAVTIGSIPVGFDPRTYGAIAGGAAATNATAIATAITNAAAVGGSVVFADLFEINAAIDPPSGTTLEGAGPGTGVKVASGANVSAIRAGGSSGSKRSKITIRDLEIDGNKANQTSLAVSHGINGNWCDDLTVEGCYIHDTNRNGVLVIGERAIIRGNRFIDCGEVTEETAPGRSGIVINTNADDKSDASPNAIVAHNVVKGYAEHGIKLYENCHDSVVQGNLVMSTVASSGWGVYVTGCSRVVVEGNRVNDAVYYGIQVVDEGSGGTMVDCVVANNVVTESTLDNINVTNLSVTSARAAVTGNVVRGGGSDGIAVAGVPYATVTGNIASDCDRHGMSIYRSSHSIVMGNQAINNGQNASLGSSSGFRLWDDGATAQEHLTLIGNHAIDDQGTATQDYGVRFQGLAANNYCYQNVSAGNATAQWEGVPASNVMHDNVGYVTRNQGVGSIASGATSATVTHGLAATPASSKIRVTLLDNPTSDPGILWVDTIGATTFKVNCRSDPGASSLDFAWQAEV